ncbi:MAG: DUF1801 domain-containing protein [Bacteroidota bacterium]|nr:DUF1801 domain-containing protein [Bacteroidota bacterium]
MTKPKDIEEYISSFPKESQKILRQLRAHIKKTAWGAEEVISYSMPAFKMNGIVVWYGAHKEHIGLYPTSSPMKVFKDELAAYKTSKGAIQFPIDKPLPFSLIAKIVKFRVRENLERAKAKTH